MSHNNFFIESIRRLDSESVTPPSPEPSRSEPRRLAHDEPRLSWPGPDTNSSSAFGAPPGLERTETPPWRDPMDHVNAAAIERAERNTRPFSRSNTPPTSHGVPSPFVGSPSAPERFNVNEPGRFSVNSLPDRYSVSIAGPPPGLGRPQRGYSGNFLESNAPLLSQSQYENPRPSSSSLPSPAMQTRAIKRHLNVAGPIKTRSRSNSITSPRMNVPKNTGSRSSTATDRMKRYLSPFSTSTRGTAENEYSDPHSPFSSPTLSPSLTLDLSHTRNMGGRPRRNEQTPLNSGRRSPRMIEKDNEYIQLMYHDAGHSQVVFVSERCWSAGNPMVRIKENLDDPHCPDVMVQRRCIQNMPDGQLKRFKVTPSHAVQPPHNPDTRIMARSREPPRGHWKMVPKYFDMVRKNIKTMEGRPIMGAAATKNVGQLVTLVEKGDNSKRLKIKMTAKYKYPNFEEMFKALGVSKFLPDFRNDQIHEAVDYYRKMPFFAMQEQEKGVVAIEFTLEADQCEVPVDPNFVAPAAVPAPSHFGGNVIEDISHIPRITHEPWGEPTRRPPPPRHMPPPMPGPPLERTPSDWVSITNM